MERAYHHMMTKYIYTVCTSACITKERKYYDLQYKTYKTYMINSYQYMKYEVKRREDNNSLCILLRPGQRLSAVYSAV